MLSLTVPLTLEEIDSFKPSFPEDGFIELKYDFSMVNKACDNMLYESAATHWLLNLVNYALQNRIKVSVNLQGTPPEHLASSMLGFVVIALSAGGKLIGIDRKESSQIRDRLFKSQEMWPDLAVSEKSFLICQDSFSNGRPTHLYPTKDSPEVIDPSNFEKLVKRLILAVTKEEYMSNEFNNYYSSVSEIIHELFKNTHDHALKTYDGKSIPHSIRAIYIRIYSVEKLRSSLSLKSDFERNFAEQFSASLLKSKKSQFSQNPSDKSNGILELSILDSGSGLAAKWANTSAKDIPPQTQLEYILECFKKGQSTIPSSERGYGLWKVLVTLRALKGLIKIRTNSVNAQREFEIQGNRAIEKVRLKEFPLEKMYDWKRGASDALSNYPEIEGSTISILIPLSSS